MTEADIYFVDRGLSNADPRDHRVSVVRPGTITPARTAVVVPPASPSPVPYTSPPTWAAPNAPFYPNTYSAGNPYWAAPNPIYQQPPMWGPPWGSSFMNTLGSLFQGINIGQVIDLVGQGFAALKALPAAPSTTGDSPTDVANLTLYQKALAEHGKLDEQIRTGVHIVAKLLGA